MPQAESFVVRAELPAGGVLVSDFGFRNADGSPAPALLRTGETIDLERVDPDGFTRSANMGILASMLEGGSLVKVMAEVSEKTFDALREAGLRHPKPKPGGRYPHATEVVTLEPGMQVAVGGAPRPTAPQPAAPPAVELPKTVSTAAEVSSPEPGLQVGTSAAEAAPAQVVLETEDGEPLSWKAGKTLAEQERFITESEDLVFLKQVAEDAKESKKLRRLAKTRLKALEP